MRVFSDDSNLYIKFNTIEKILGVHWSFTIPLNMISSIHTDPLMRLSHGFRFPGTFFPGLIKAGTYLTNRGKEFWYTTRSKNFLSIEIKQGFYKRIILSVNGNESIKNKIQEKIGPDNFKK
jgi:hypothetical protein